MTKQEQFIDAVRTTGMVLLVLLVAVLFAVSAGADNSLRYGRVPGYPVPITLSWEALDCPDVRGYRVYIGNTDPPQWLQWAGRGTHYDVTLETGRTYYFGVRSVDVFGNEDPMSPVVRVYAMPGQEGVFIERMVRKVWVQFNPSDFGK